MVERVHSDSLNDRFQVLAVSRDTDLTTSYEILSLLTHLSLSFIIFSFILRDFKLGNPSFLFLFFFCMVVNF